MLESTRNFLWWCTFMAQPAGGEDLHPLAGLRMSINRNILIWWSSTRTESFLRSLDMITLVTWELLTTKTLTLIIWTRLFFRVWPPIRNNSLESARSSMTPRQERLRVCKCLSFISTIRLECQKTHHTTSFHGSMLTLRPNLVWRTLAEPLSRT